MEAHSFWFNSSSRGCLRRHREWAIGTFILKSPDLKLRHALPLQVIQELCRDRSESSWAVLGYLAQLYMPVQQNIFSIFKIMINECYW